MAKQVKNETEYTVSWKVEEYADSPEEAALKVAKEYFQPRIAHGVPGTACVFTIDSIDYPIDRILPDLSPQDMANHFDHNEHPGYPRRNWRDEVERDHTLLGYWAWVSHELGEQP